MKKAITAAVNDKMKKYTQYQDEYDRLRASEYLITKDLLNVSNNLNTSWQGLEYSIKTAGSIEDKLDRITVDNPNLLNMQLKYILNDIFRYTQICKHEEIFNVAKKTITELENKGYILSLVNNYYKNPNSMTGYKGLHLNFITPSGLNLEIQVHSNESFMIKQKSHTLYEELRAVTTTDKDKEKISKEILDIHKKIKNPPGYLELDNYLLSKSKRIKYMKELKGNLSTKIYQYNINGFNNINNFAIKILNANLKGDNNCKLEIRFWNENSQVNNVIILNQQDFPSITTIICDKNNNIKEIKNLEYSNNINFTKIRDIDKEYINNIIDKIILENEVKNNTKTQLNRSYIVIPESIKGTLKINNSINNEEYKNI